MTLPIFNEDAAAGTTEEGRRELIRAQLARLAAPLLAHRWKTTDEKAIQAAIGTVWYRSGISYDAEHRFDARSRADFFVRTPFGPIDLGIAVEVKLRWATTALIAQIHRYARHETVAGILVLTTSHRIAVEMPNELVGKPVLTAHLRSAL